MERLKKERETHSRWSRKLAAVGGGEGGVLVVCLAFTGQGREKDE